MKPGAGLLVLDAPARGAMAFDGTDRLQTTHALSRASPRTLTTTSTIPDTCIAKPHF